MEPPITDLLRLTDHRGCTNRYSRRRSIFCAPEYRTTSEFRITDKRCVPNDTFKYKITSDNGQVGGARVGRAQKKKPGHAFSFSSRYAGCIRTLLAFGRESDPNSNCSCSLAWSASCPSSSYRRRRDKRISRNAIAGKTYAVSASEMMGIKNISLHDWINTLIL